MHWEHNDQRSYKTSNQTYRQNGTLALHKILTNMHTQSTLKSRNKSLKIPVFVIFQSRITCQLNHFISLSTHTMTSLSPQYSQVKVQICPLCMRSYIFALLCLREWHSRCLPSIRHQDGGLLTARRNSTKLILYHDWRQGLLFMTCRTCILMHNITE